MSKQDWLDYFEAVNGRSASAEEIAQALAAGEFQEKELLFYESKKESGTEIGNSLEFDFVVLPPQS